MTFSLLPAIDIRDARVVRLYQGDFGRQIDYSVKPSELAERYGAAGAEWLHVVDLDGARQGQSGNEATIRQLVQSGLRVQAGGGVRCREDVLRLLRLGVERVIIGSVAMREPEKVCGWLDEFGNERLVLALDTRWRDNKWRLYGAGWTSGEAATLDDLASRYAAAGARHLLCTDIDSDGTLGGINRRLYQELRRANPTLAIQVSGGVRSIDDIRAAIQLGSTGIVLGRALLDGRFSMADAMTTVNECSRQLSRVAVAGSPAC